MKKLIVDLENQNGVLVNLTAEEIAELETLKQQEQTKQAEIETAKQADATNKANGNQKFLDLGLTQAEATALTGYKPEVTDGDN